MEWLHNIFGGAMSGRLTSLYCAFGSILFVCSFLGVPGTPGLGSGTFEVLGNFFTWAGATEVGGDLASIRNWFDERDVTLLWLVAGAGLAMGVYRYGDGENGAIVPTATAALMFGLAGASVQGIEYVLMFSLTLVLGTLVGWWTAGKQYSYWDSLQTGIIRLIAPVIYPLLVILLDPSEDRRRKELG